MGSVLSCPVDGAAVAVAVGGVAFAFRSTCGVTADCAVVAGAGSGAGAPDAGAARGVLTCAVVVCAVLWVVTFAGFAAAGRAACLTLLLVAEVAVLVVAGSAGGVVSAVAGDVLVSVVGGASVAGAGWDVVAGAVPAGTGCVSWAKMGVEESARAAAIAGRALVRA
jgi:hypothetical protein